MKIDITATSESNKKKLVLGNVSTTLGNRVFDYTNQILITNLFPNSVAFMALYQNSETIIHAALNLVGGNLGDKYSKKKLLVITDILSGIICTIFYFFYQTEYVIYALLIANISLASIGSVNYPIYMSIPKDCILTDRIKQYNSSLVSWREVSKLLGPMLGLVMVTYLSIGLAYIFNIVSFFVSAYLESRLQVIHPEHEAYNRSKPKEGLFKSVAAAVKYLKSQQYIFRLILLAAVVNFFLAGYNLALPYTKVSYGTISNFYGFFLTAEALGAIAAGFINARIKHEFNIAFTLIFCGGFLVAFDTLSSLHNIIGIGLLLGTIFMFGFSLALFNINFSTTVQATISAEFISRVWSLVGTITLISMPAGAAVFSFIYAQDVDYIFGLVGTGIVVVSLIFALVYHRKPTNLV